MSTITRERLEQLANFRGAPVTRQEEQDLARIALASLEAEAVGKVVLGEYDDCGCHPNARVACIAADGQADWENFKDGTRLYAAPPATESVPDEVLKRLLPDAERAEFWFEHDGKILFEGVKFNNAVFEACRAAMLQGAEPVTTANKLPFEQWLSQQTGTIDVECGCVMTEVFFHWLRVAYEAGNSPVIPDGWVACSEWMPEREIDVQVYCSDKKEQMVGYMERNEQDGYFRFASLPNGGGVYCQPTHWQPLPAAPKQEAKNV